MTQEERTVIEAAQEYIEDYDAHIEWVLTAKLPSEEQFQKQLKEREENVVAKRKALAHAVYQLKAA